MEEEILKISHLAEHYTVISFDTEFPGTVKMPQKFNDDDVFKLKFRMITNSLKKMWTFWSWSKLGFVYAMKKETYQKKDWFGNLTSNSTLSKIPFIISK